MHGHLNNKYLTDYIFIMKLGQEIKDFSRGYISNYRKHIGLIVGSLGGMSLADNIGHLRNLPTNEILFTMVVYGITLGIVGSYIFDSLYSQKRTH